MPLFLLFVINHIEFKVLGNKCLKTQGGKEGCCKNKTKQKEKKMEENCFSVCSEDLLQVEKTCKDLPFHFK